MLKLGRSEAGKHFAISHSGAISGSNAAYDAVFERHGIIQVRNLDELLDTVELLTMLAYDGRLPVSRLARIPAENGS